VVVTIGGGNGAEQLADLVISTPLANGDFVGTLDVTCVGYMPSQCGTGGIVDISGSLSPSGTLDVGTAANPDLFAGTYSGGDTFTGVATSLDGDVYDWTFNRASVPEPATLSLLGLGLAGVGFLRKRKRN
jgi:PEP-CTERM motif